MTDTKRRICSRCLVASLILLCALHDLSTWLHIALGILFLALLVVHLAKYAKWFKASTKACLKRKLKGKTKAKVKYLIAAGLLVAFALSILSGFACAYELLFWGETSAVVHRIHTASSIAGGLLSVAHVALWATGRKKAIPCFR